MQPTPDTYTLTLAGYFCADKRSAQIEPNTVLPSALLPNGTIAVDGGLETFIPVDFSRTLAGDEQFPLPAPTAADPHGNVHSIDWVARMVDTLDFGFSGTPAAVLPGSALRLQTRHVPTASLGPITAELATGHPDTARCVAYWATLRAAPPDNGMARMGEDTYALIEMSDPHTPHIPFLHWAPLPTASGVDYTVLPALLDRWQSKLGCLGYKGSLPAGYAASLSAPPGASASFHAERSRRRMGCGPFNPESQTETYAGDKSYDPAAPALRGTRAVRYVYRQPTPTGVRTTPFARALLEHRMCEKADSSARRLTEYRAYRKENNITGRSMGRPPGSANRLPPAKRAEYLVQAYGPTLRENAFALQCRASTRVSPDWTPRTADAPSVLDPTRAGTRFMPLMPDPTLLSLPRHAFSHIHPLHVLLDLVIPDYARTALRASVEYATDTALSPTLYEATDGNRTYRYGCLSLTLPLESLLALAGTPANYQALRAAIAARLPAQSMLTRMPPAGLTHYQFPHLRDVPLVDGDIIDATYAPLGGTFDDLVGGQLSAQTDTAQGEPA